ncbi:16062_t:CDS:2 [Rhizophagus irregularis]|nr:16062_t:CDS:2 [Rhizophagus irregularis]
MVAHPGTFLLELSNEAFIVIDKKKLFLASIISNNLNLIHINGLFVIGELIKVTKPDEYVEVQQITFEVSLLQSLEGTTGSNF